MVDTNPTVGVNCSRIFQSKYEKIVYSILDTSGQDHFFGLIPNYFSGTNAIILFTDVNEHEEYKSLKAFIDLVLDNFDSKGIPLFYLSTTKTDLGWNNTKEEIESFFHLNFNLNLKFFITSLDDLKSINFMFDSMIDDLIEKYQLDVKPQLNNECLIL